MTWPWNGRSAAYGTQETPETGTIAPPPGAAAAVTGRCGVDRGVRGHVLLVQDGRRHDLRVLGQVPAERLGPDPGRPQQLRGPQGVGGDDDRAGGDRRPLAGGHVDDLDPGRPVAVEHDPPGQRAGAQLDVRPLPEVAGDDRRAGPVQGAVLPHRHRDRHRPDRAAVRPVEELPEHLLHRAGQRRAVEGVRGDGQQLLGAGQRLVQHGGVDEVGHLVVHRPRAGRGPVRAHPADVRGHGRVRHGRRADQRGAGPGGAFRRAAARGRWPAPPAGGRAPRRRRCS